MVEEMAIPQTDCRRLLKQMQIAEKYQKTRHVDRCAEDCNCASHCTTFALSDSNCSAYFSKCNREHKSMCSDCTNIVRTLDEIQEAIEKISNLNLLAELKHDFENASQHIIEWSLVTIFVLRNKTSGR